jgi:hypothetical protein
MEYHLVGKQHRFTISQRRSSFPTFSLHLREIFSAKGIMGE